VTVVGFDLSPASRDALAVAVEGHRDGDVLIVVHASPVVDTSHDPHTGRRGERRRQEHVGEVRDAVAQIAGDLPSSVEFRGGPPAAAILQAARFHDAQTIVIGRSGRRRRPWPLARTTRALLRDADRPVLVVSPVVGTPRPVHASPPGEIPVDWPLVR
jgi:nucleotide-binding universal stress UspA family protein